MVCSSAAKTTGERTSSAGKTVCRTEKIFMKKARLRMGKRRHGNKIVNIWKTKRHDTLSN
ncbi:hypothetical protein C6A63_12080 [Escherichia coli]|uniref:Uncharacterized protein n=1 Tax=Escherichia coli TaxID=562 RepID=A0A1V2GB89_ECOLX|nr:hypothetical protein BE963_22290 [Escherichia coli]ATI07604.1 hypothetical protein CO715_18910 [Escherichia coli M12]EFO3123101.1 hypothetical protein [Escherichia coli O73]ASX06139.1 hypothetical protein CA696_013415 [Escherichia coli]EAA1349109.1 hypothetical protein [Escherichia coli]